VGRGRRAAKGRRGGWNYPDGPPCSQTSVRNFQNPNIGNFWPSLRNFSLGGCQSGQEEETAQKLRLTMHNNCIQSITIEDNMTNE
jgi:hypothetical protein